MAPKQPCAKYTYVVTAAGPKILPVDEPCKDEESPADYNSGGYLQVKVNDTFHAGRYRVVRKLGWGHFSTVWLVKDQKSQRHSALKVVKSAGRYAETARDEIKILAQVAAAAPQHPGRDFIVSFLDSFLHEAPDSSHVCIVFEPLGENLLALIERNKKKGVPRALVRVIAKQILLGLEYLHDECDMVHTDIKPENILISIPDIESHIQAELTQSPSPTSRRVGVPLPTKPRPGVSIPYNSQRARRQVQIFDSQPLASPGRSLGRSAHGNSSVSMRPGSGAVSQMGSYVPPGHLSRNGSIFISGPAGSFSSSAPKVPSGLSMSNPRNNDGVSQQKVFAAKGITAVPTRVTDPPSTSSSSSSISSVLASANAGSSSIVSTPPTSLSQSIGNIVFEFLGTTRFEAELQSRTRISPKSSAECDMDLPIPLAKKLNGKVDLEHELSSAISTSWKDPDYLSEGKREKLSTSLTSNKSTGSQAKSSKVRQSGHGRSNSGISASKFWKDPGIAAPAPAVLVSAVVGAGGREGDYTKVPGLPNGASETSSGRTSIGRPSPSATPLPMNKSGPLQIASKRNSDTPNISSPLTNEIRAMEAPVHIPTASHPSLLTQTAPPKSTPGRPATRASPTQHISQLSAHMHAFKPCNPTFTSQLRTTSRAARALNTRNGGIDSSTTPKPPSPAPPPSSPAGSVRPKAGPADCVSDDATSTAQSASGRSLPHLQVHAIDGIPSPPPISIKIADLGNATPSKKHFTEEIQTRQYRAPEAILGRKDWDARADIWSVACLIFELLTGEYLFDPQAQGELFAKDDDHMAQIIELLGDFPLEVKMGGKYSRELFDHTGSLRYIRTLKPWPLERVMTEKYLFSSADSQALCEFLLPMLTPDMRQRAHARDMKEHKWLEPHKEDGDVLEW